MQNGNETREKLPRNGAKLTVAERHSENSKTHNTELAAARIERRELQPTRRNIMIQHSRQHARLSPANGK